MEETGRARQAAAGDAAAFAALVRMHEAKVRRFLNRLTRGDGADDLAQEVFVKAWSMRASWREEGSYGAWLMRIAWTSFLSARRADTRRMERDFHTLESSTPGAEFAPEAALDVDRALASLDERERAAAMLCFAEGYSHGEAARIMDLPLGTLKSIVARARARLVQSLESSNE
ncbi:MAG TPA: sigma-70 family RNA polymerase sigma factor [Allosphingosinicella sp.]|jgi:RNA polymerase sigma-70 factor (ECF subfamily)